MGSNAYAESDEREAEAAEYAADPRAAEAPLVGADFECAARPGSLFYLRY